MVGTHVHPARVRRHVIDPVGNGLARAVAGEIMPAGGRRLTLGRHSRPAFLNSPTSSFFLVSTLITGSPLSWWARACPLM